MVVEPVAAGEQIPDSAIGSTGISNDSRLRADLSSNRSDPRSSARSLLVDLEPGDLLGPSMVTSEPDTFDGERLVGAVLRAGRYPEEIQRGDEALAVSIVDRAPANRRRSRVRVVAVSFSETAEASVTLAVAEADAALVGTWAGTDELVVVVRPIGADAVTRDRRRLVAWHRARRRRRCCSRPLRRCGATTSWLVEADPAGGVLASRAPDLAGVNSLGRVAFDAVGETLSRRRLQASSRRLGPVNVVTAPWDSFQAWSADRITSHARGLRRCGGWMGRGRGRCRFAARWVGTVVADHRTCRCPGDGDQHRSRQR